MTLFKFMIFILYKQNLGIISTKKSLKKHEYPIKYYLKKQLNI